MVDEKTTPFRCGLLLDCGLCGCGHQLAVCYGLRLWREPGDPHGVWFIYLVYAVGAFWIAWRKRAVAFGWIGSALLLVSLGQALGAWLDLSFPWQTALLAHASLCAVAAIAFARREHTRRLLNQPLSGPLNLSALVSSFLVIWLLLINGQSETTSMLAQSVFWLAGIWLVSLWLNRRQELFTSFQIALTVALVLAIKAALQDYDWYAYLPHAFLHPTALQIQGTALVLLSLVWVAVRFALVRQT